MTVTAPGPPCCGIVPPHLFQEIAARGDRRQRERALSNLDVATSFRAARIGRSSRRLISRRLLRRQRPAWLARLRQRQAAPNDKSRSIYDARNKRQLPGTLVRREGAGPTGDVAVDEAYDYMGDTFDFYWEVYGRDSVDNEGLPLIGTVHYDEDYDNAFWNGEQMVYGDGDGELFNRFTIAVDVIGHELTHGVTENEAGLIYWGQAGAVNESVSDVFGSLVKQAVNQQTADAADWLIGEGLFTDQVQGVALRSMADPGTAYDDPVLGKDPQPGNMNDYVRTISDNGGVHINSGIPNHAFYLAAVEIGGYAWETAGRIWYETLQSPSLAPSAQFSAFARITVQTAQSLYGSTSTEADAVSAAWSTVGVQVGSTARRVRV
jgi:Zn-dependent metalloprotease